MMAMPDPVLETLASLLFTQAESRDSLGPFLYG